MREFTKEQVEKHNHEKSCWHIINGDVYDVTSLLNTHPGGDYILLQIAGYDSTELFNDFYKHTEESKIKLEKCKIGRIIKN